MTTPDTTQTAQQREAELDQELVDALGDELDRQAGGHVSRTAINERAEALLNAIGEQMAAIRRQAAADALTEAARSLGKTAAFMREQGQAAAARGRLDSFTTYTATSDAYYNAANRLRTAAADKLAEGYAHTCAASFAATWTDPGYGCDTRVPDLGDYCPKHEPEDDDDPRWAE